MHRFSSKSATRLPKKERHRAFIEPLEARIAPAFTMALSSSATVGVSASLAGNTTTFTATATGANLSWADVESALSAGHNVVVTSGTTGTEAGNIVANSTGIDLSALPSGLTLTFQSGTGTGLVGNISLGALALGGTNESVVIHATGSVTTGLLCAGSQASPLALANVAITAGTSVSGGIVESTDVSISAKTGIGTAAAPFLTAASALVANNSSANTNAGGIFITNGTVSNPLALTVGFPSDPFHGIQDTTLNTDPITLINFGSININNHTVANEIVSAPGNVIVTANGATSDILGGTGLNTTSNSNGALQGVIVAENGSATVTAGRDLLLGDSGGMNLPGNVLAGGTVSLNAGRNLTIDDGTLIYGGRFGSVNGQILATAQGNISLQNIGGNGANLRTDEGAIILTTGHGGNFTAHAGNAQVTDIVGGPITLNADSVTLLDPFVFGDGEYSIRIEPATPGLQIDLGTNPSMGKLGLSNADLATMDPTVLYIGDTINTGGIINTAAITPPSGVSRFNIALQCNGSIVESGGSISGFFVSFQATTGIGSAAPMQLASGSFVAFDNTVSGAVQISGASFLNVGAANDLTSSTNLGSTTTLSAAGKLDFNSGTTSSAGDLTATANASGGVGQLLTVDFTTTVKSTGGSVTLNASGGITVTNTGSVSAAGSINLNGDVGNPQPGTGAVFTLNGAMSGSSITATGNVNNDTFNVGLPLLHSGVTLNIAGGGGTDSLPLAGGGTDVAVWTPSSTKSYAGALAINSSPTTTINYSESSGGTLVPSLSAEKSLTLNSASAAHYTLGTATKGVASLSTDASVSNVEQIVFTNVPTLDVNLGTSELSTDSSSFTFNSLVDDVALSTLAVVTGQGNDFLTLHVGILGLPSTGGSGFTWTGGKGTDTVNATAGASFNLSNTGLTYPASSGVSFPHSDVEVANLTDTAGGNAFTLNGWTGSGALTDSGTNPDTVTASGSGNYTLTNTNLSNSNHLNMTLSNIATANLTDTGGGHSFTLNGWTGSGSLKDTGSSADTVNATEPGSFTLTNASLTNSNGLSMTLSKITKANLTDSGGGNSFTVSGWSGSGSLNDIAANADTVVDARAASFVLSDSELLSTDGVSYTMSNIGVANLTDTAGGFEFILDDWTGSGSLIGAGSIASRLNATDSGSFTLSNGMITNSDGLSMTLTNITSADLFDTGGNNSFTVSGWTGTGSLSTGNVKLDSVIASKNASFTLDSGDLITSDGMEMILNGIATANLTDTGGGNSFTVSNWSGNGSLSHTGSGTDTVIATKSGSFTLSDTNLSSTDGMNLTLTDIIVAELIDLGGNNSFTVSGWTGSGSLTSSGSIADTVIAAKFASFTLADSSLSSTDGMSLLLTDIHTANLTDTGGGESFTVSNWTGSGSLIGAGSSTDTVIAAKNGSFSLSNSALSSADGMSLILNLVTGANLTDTGGGNSFTLYGWTGSGSLNDGGTIPDSLIANESGSYTLADGSVSNSSGLNMSLTKIATANLTDSEGGNSFTVSGWTGTGSLINLGARADSVIAAKAAGFILTDAALSSDDGMALNFSQVGGGIRTANLTDTAGGHSFTVTGWTYGGSIGASTGSDTVNYVDTIVQLSQGLNPPPSIGVVLTDALLYSGNGMQLALANIGAANLTAGSGADETIDASHYSGALQLTGSQGNTGSNNDVLIAGTGHNTLIGGIQADRFVLTGFSKSDTLTPSIESASGVEQQQDLIDYSARLYPINYHGFAKVGVNVNLGLIGKAQMVNSRSKDPAIASEGVLTLTGLFDDLSGTKYSDHLTGDKLVNIIYGGQGADRLAGGGVPKRGAHDYLLGSASTVFVPPARGSGEIDSLYRTGVSPFADILPIIVPQAVFRIANATTDDPFIEL